MNPEKIKYLLEKYFEGTTPVEEEAALRKYFQTEDRIPTDLRPYQPLFRYFGEVQTLQLSDDFEEQLKERMEVPSSMTPAVRRLWPTLARVAAVILVALGIWWAYPIRHPAPQQASIDWSKYEPETPEEAYRITRSALAKLSGEIAEGAQKAAQEVDKMEKVGRYMR